MFDADQEGRIEISEVKEAFINLGFHQSSIFSERIFDYMTTLNEGKIDFADFIKLATTRISDKYTQDECNVVFTAFDYKNTGKFNIYDLKDTIRDIGADIDDDEIERMFKNADTDEDGLVTREDFYNIVTHKV